MQNRSYDDEQKENEEEGKEGKIHLQIASLKL